MKKQINKNNYLLIIIFVTHKWINVNRIKHNIFEGKNKLILRGIRSINTINYDRKVAVNYAIRYAMKPNTQKYPYYKGDDCSNFVSQCLNAGGLNETGGKWSDLNAWFCNTNNPKDLKNISLTWRAARYFRRYWGNENGLGNDRAYECVEMMAKEVLENIKDIYNWLNIGDVLQYGKEKNNHIASHTQIIIHKKFNNYYNSVDLYIAQHSANRIYVSLYEYIDKLEDINTRKVYLYKMVNI